VFPDGMLIEVETGSPALVVVGTDHQRAAVALREQVAFRRAELPGALDVLRRYVREGFILSTCNRTEIYALTCARDGGVESVYRFLEHTRGIPVQAQLRATYVHRQRTAVRHLYRVASGLASMMLGEPQILAQLRAAVEAARAVGTLGPVLSRAGAQAIRVGKRARSETGIARNRLSLPHIAVDLAADHLGGLCGRRAVVVGAGQMSTLTARLLRAAAVADLVILNRTEDRADALARATGGRSGPLDALAAELAGAALVISAVAAPHGFLIDAATLRRRSGAAAHPLLAIDLGVPRTIDPDLRSQPGVRLFDLDDLDQVAAERRQACASDLRAAEAIVEAAVEEFLAWWSERPVAPTIAALREQAEAIRVQELDRALRRLGSLSERDRNVVAALSVALINKLLHEPVTRLKQDDDREQTARIVRHLFGLDGGSIGQGSDEAELLTTGLRRSR
jgi:glutamyl-tRNA reductase